MVKQLCEARLPSGLKPTLPQAPAAGLKECPSQVHFVRQL